MSESLLFNRIATDLYDPGQVLEEIRTQERPQPGPESLAAGAEATPDTLVEQELAQIWAELLRLETVGVHDNFFSLGGHSLLAMQVLNRVREVFGIELPLNVLFTSTFTIAELAKTIRAYQASLNENASALDELEALSEQEVEALLAQAGTDELAALLSELDDLSDDELEALLADVD